MMGALSRSVCRTMTRSAALITLLADGESCGPRYNRLTMEQAETIRDYLARRDRWIRISRIAAWVLMFKIVRTSGWSAMYASICWKL